MGYICGRIDGFVDVNVRLRHWVVLDVSTNRSVFIVGEKEKHCDSSKCRGPPTKRRSVTPNTPPGALLSAHLVPQRLSHSTHKTRRNEASSRSGTRSADLNMKTTPVTYGNYWHFASRSVRLLSVQKTSAQGLTSRSVHLLPVQKT